MLSALLGCALIPASGFHLADARMPAPQAGVSQKRALSPAKMAIPPQTVTALALNSGLAALGQVKGQKMLTTSGLANAWSLGVMLWVSLGWRGWSTCVLYLVCGSAVTKVKKAKKESLGIAEGRGGRRGPENVWGSAATAAITGAPPSALSPPPFVSARSLPS